MSEPTYYKVEEAAEELGITQPGVYRLVKQGYLASLKFGRVIRITIDSVERYKANKPQLQDMISIEDIASRLKISNQTASTMIKKHNLSRQRIGKKFGVPRAEFETFLTAITSGATPVAPPVLNEDVESETESVVEIDERETVEA